MAKTNKLLALLVVCAMALTMLPLGAFAATVGVNLATAVVDPTNSDIYKIELSYTSTDVAQVTLLAVNNAQNPAVDDSNISYIDQKVAAASGDKLTFKVDVVELAKAYPAGTRFAKLYFKVGGTGISSPFTSGPTGPASSGFDSGYISVPLKVVDLPAPTIAVTPVTADVDASAASVIGVSFTADASYAIADYKAADNFVLKFGTVAVTGAWSGSDYVLDADGIAAIKADMGTAASKTYTVTAKADGFLQASTAADAFTATSKENELKALFATYFDTPVMGASTTAWTAKHSLNVTVDKGVTTPGVYAYTYTDASSGKLVLTSVTAATTAGPVTVDDTTPGTYTIPQDEALDATATFTFTYTDGAFVATIVVTEKVVSKLGPQTPAIDKTKSAVYTTNNPFTLTGFKRVFIKLDEDGSDWVATHTDTDSFLAYSVERQGFDCLIKTTDTTVDDVLAEITWAEGTPDSIAKYGDLVAPFGTLNALDMAFIKKVGLGTQSPAATKLQLMTGDTDNNSTLNALDMANIKKIGLGTGTIPIISQ